MVYYKTNLGSAGEVYTVDDKRLSEYLVLGGGKGPTVGGKQ